jgi:hypothetical protein
MNAELNAGIMRAPLRYGSNRLTLPGSETEQNEQEYFIEF